MAHGTMGHDMTTRHKTQHGTWHNGSRYDNTAHDTTWHNMAHCTMGHDMTTRHMTQHGTIWHIAQWVTI
jgi:hypothetical protein